jgi:molecular chaperone GrpE
MPKAPHDLPESEVEQPLEEVVESTEPEAPVSAEPDYKDMWQRSLAELENLRKRELQERQNVSKFALKGFLEELLPVVDNFYRATEHVPAELQNSPWVSGILYIQKNLLDVMAQRGVSIIEAKPGDEFDPSHHEAIGVTESEYPEGKIAIVNGQGYMLHDRVLRPTQVTVSK